jgi:hypothetical protein
LIREFTALTDTQIPGLNRELQAGKLPPLAVLAEKDWK